MRWARIFSALAAAVFAGAAVMSAAQGQQLARPIRIGVLHIAFAPDHPGFEGFRRGMADAGFAEGRDVVFDLRFTSGVIEGLPDAARSVIAGGVALVFALGERAVQAAREASGQRPIVFSGVGDPVAAGIVKSIPRPQGNVTGISSLVTELVPKRLEILKQLSPELRRVRMFYNPGDPEAAAAARRAAEAAPLLGLEFSGHAVHTTQELAGALAALEPGEGSVAFESPALDLSNQVLRRSRVVGAPAIYSSAFWVGHGAVLGYGADHFDMGRQAARLAAKILRGAKPEDVPVEGANKILLAINLKTAEALGLTIPQSILVRADVVIE